jgi:hypothetical protein
VFILVQDAAQAVTSANVEVCELVWIGERFGQWMEWSGVRDVPMGPVGVVMPLVFVQGVQEVCLVPDQHAVQQLVGGSFGSIAA